MDRIVDTNDKLKIISSFLKEKKYSYIKILDISKISTLCDYFIIVSFNNMRTLEVVEDELEDFVASKNIIIRSSEGKGTNWILLDLDDIIVHLFNENDRSFYNLEKLWADAEFVDIK